MWTGLSDGLKGKDLIAELKLALIPTPDVICSFNKLIIECLLCAGLYAELGVKQNKRSKSCHQGSYSLLGLMNKGSDNYIWRQWPFWWRHLRSAWGVGRDTRWVRGLEEGQGQRRIQREEWCPSWVVKDDILQGRYEEGWVLGLGLRARHGSLREGLGEGWEAIPGKGHDGDWKR